MGKRGWRQMINSGMQAAVGFQMAKKAKQAHRTYVQPRGGKKVQQNLVKSKSHSKTKTKSKSKTKVVREQTSGESTSYTLIKYKRKAFERTWTKLGNTCDYEGIGTVGITQVQSLQQVAVPVVGVYATDIQNVFSQAGSFWNDTTSTVIQLDPAHAGYKYNKFNIMTYECIFEFINQEPSDVSIELYDLISKVTEPTVRYANADWNNGLINQQGIAAVNSYTQPYTVPTDSKLFNMTWRIHKKTVIRLAPGRLHKHTFKFHVNRVVDMGYWNDYAQVRGLTYQLMVVARGTPSDTVAGSTVGSIALTPVKIIGTFRYKYHAQIISAFPRNVSLLSALTTGNAALYVENPATDIAENVMTAANIA